MLAEQGNPIVFFDISIAENPVGRMKMELFRDRCPRTAENFRQLCVGQVRERGVPMGYKGAPFHRLSPGAVLQGGDFLHGDGTGHFSIYGGGLFEDEPGGLALKHDREGLLSMVSSGPGTNGCQFYITLGACDYLDGKNVVFGHVIEGGMDIVTMISKVGAVGSRPRLPVTITECGQY